MSWHSGYSDTNQHNGYNTTMETLTFRKRNVSSLKRKMNRMNSFLDPLCCNDDCDDAVDITAAQAVIADQMFRR